MDFFFYLQYCLFKINEKKPSIADHICVMLCLPQILKMSAKCDLHIQFIYIIHCTRRTNHCIYNLHLKKVAKRYTFHLVIALRYLVCCSQYISNTAKECASLSFSHLNPFTIDSPNPLTHGSRGWPFHNVQIMHQSVNPLLQIAINHTN